MKYLFSLIIVCTCICLKAQTIQTCNCCSEEQRQFDFWLGNWETFSNGKVAGHNKITSIQDSCVMLENWTSSNGTYTGTSYNFYDLQIKKWRQIWIDNQGQHIETSGGLQEGAMVLYSAPIKSKEGKETINRITWTNNEDGTVRQHWEASQDNQSTWKTVFDGLYKKVKQ